MSCRNSAAVKPVLDSYAEATGWELSGEEWHYLRQSAEAEGLYAMSKRRGDKDYRDAAVSMLTASISHAPSGKPQTVKTEAANKVVSALAGKPLTEGNLGTFAYMATRDVNKLRESVRRRLAADKKLKKLGVRHMPSAVDRDDWKGSRFTVHGLDVESVDAALYPGWEIEDVKVLNNGHCIATVRCPEKLADTDSGIAAQRDLMRTQGDAVWMAEIPKAKIGFTGDTGTSYRVSSETPLSGGLSGYVTTTYDELVDTFGEPTNLDGDKTNSEWRMEFYTEDGPVTATVYDWKEPLTPTGSYSWHIGGSDAGRLLVGKALGRFTDPHILF